MAALMYQPSALKLVLLRIYRSKSVSLRDVARWCGFVIAFFKVERHFELGQMLPMLRLCEKLPAISGIIRSLLATQRTQCAVARNAFRGRLRSNVHRLGH